MGVKKTTGNGQETVGGGTNAAAVPVHHYEYLAMPSMFSREFIENKTLQNVSKEK